MLEIEIKDSKGHTDRIICKGARINPDTEAIEILHENNDLQYYNWNFVISIRYKNHK